MERLTFCYDKHKVINYIARGCGIYTIIQCQITCAYCMLRMVFYVSLCTKLKSPTVGTILPNNVMKTNCQQNVTADIDNCTWQVILQLTKLWL